MIVDHIRNFHFYKGIHERINQAIDYIQQTDFTNIQTGTHEIDGENLFFNLIEYETKTPDERFWESHKKYLDVHYILEGKEYIGCESFERMEIKQPYDEQDDYYLLEGGLKSMVRMQKGDFMILFPQDAHMTGIMVDTTEKVRKVVFKIKL
ncbi:YhcH/YjgK/YiaL family protein [Bacillus sp. UNC438CL73TsuS30]|uniref:YhcH/YjgK/YiaL family protein n=1 Tax=Bacillus sp. UNC438CL73TsuS30 TaxID=1340434 RepID=UPI00047E48C4|nr:YhcH/YjgK/YiaL family protein [Bacillus sp. UNC438CL73TsuS30]